MHMTSNIRQVGHVAVVDLSGRIMLGEESASLRELVASLLSKGNRDILFNLAEVQYIDSSGLGALVSGMTSVRKQGGHLKLLKLTNKVTDVLQITKLYTVFDIFDDEQAAVDSFGPLATATGA
jgi:anti-sigma B factor antagonist